jgi:hypothetical protein
MEHLMPAQKQYRGVPVPDAVRGSWHRLPGLWWRAGVDAKSESLPFVVEPGQVYADNDPRSEGRTLRVDRIEGAYAICTVLTDRVMHDENWVSQIGRPTKIKVRRLYPNARGYRRLEEDG